MGTAKMTDCLWNDIDSAIKDAVETDMGLESSLYTSLLLEEVVVTDMFDSDWRNLRTPAVIIVTREFGPGNRSEFDPQGPHGDGDIHIDLVYPYWMVVVHRAESSYSDLKVDIKELVRRLREVYRAHSILGGISSSDGEQVIDSTIGDSSIEIRGNPGGDFVGMGIMPWEVYTTI